MRAASAHTSLANGCGLMMIALRVSSASMILKKTVATGFVDGVSARTTPAGRGISTIFADAVDRGRHVVVRAVGVRRCRREQATFLSTLCSATPNPVSRDGLLGELLRVRAAPPRPRPARCAARSRCRSVAKARAAHSARSIIARPRGTPAGSSGMSAISAVIAPRLPPAPMTSRSAPADRDLGAVEQLLDDLGLQQDAGLELQHPRVERREDRPDAVLVQVLHHVLGALRVRRTPGPMIDAVLADADEPVRVLRLDVAQAACRSGRRCSAPSSGSRAASRSPAP